MLRRRVIPVLLLRGRGLYKTERFAEPSYVGDPINVVKIFNDKEVDELVLLDIDATRRGQEPDYALLEQIASEAFMPVCYGGGVRSVAQARRLLKLGLEKVAVNTAALQDLSLVRGLSDAFGAQCVVGAVDVKAEGGVHRVWSHAGQAVPEPDPVAWAQQLERAGAGELLVTSVQRDGTLTGMDVALFSAIKRAVQVPVVACGGARGVDDVLTTLKDAGVSAVGAGARFVYYGPHRAVLVRYLFPDELERVQRETQGT